MIRIVFGWFAYGSLGQGMNNMPHEKSMKELGVFRSEEGSYKFL